MLADTVLTCKGIFFLFPIILVLWFLIPYLTCPLRGTPGPFIAGESVFPSDFNEFNSMEDADHNMDRMD